MVRRSVDMPSSFWFTRSQTKFTEGDFKTGQVTAKTLISAAVFGNVVLQVFWRDSSGNTVFSKDTGTWGSPTSIGAIPAGYEIAVAQWGDGVHLRIYYQDFAGIVRELCTDNSASSWFTGALTVN